MKAPHSPVDLLMSVGGLVGHLSLHDPPPSFMEQVRSRYRPFMIPPAHWARRSFSLRVAFPGSHGSPLASEGRPTPLSFRETDQALEMERAGARARLESSPTGTWVGHASLPPNQHLFDSILRVFWSALLSRAGGALLHACGLRHENAGLVFAGKSEAGKSTLSRKMENPDRVLSDEQVAVYRDPGGRWRVAGTPFWGDFCRPGGSIRSWPLRALCFLRKGPTLDVQPATTGDAVRRLLECIMCYQSDGAAVARNLAIAVRVCTSVSTLVVQSRLDTPCADVLEAVRPFGHGDIEVQDRHVPIREAISELRWAVDRHGSYPFRPTGSSMRPSIRSGDSVMVERVKSDDLVPGDVVLYWTPGVSENDDRLICHRLVGRGGRSGDASSRRESLYIKGDTFSRFSVIEEDRHTEILGRVSAVSRNGTGWRRTTRVGNLAWLAASLLTAPIPRMRGAG